MFVVVTLAMFAYGFVHSWLAGNGIKLRFRQFIGDQRYYGLYRAVYNLLAIVTLGPVLGLIVFLPGNIVWQIGGLGQFILLGIQIVGLIGLIASLFQIDLGQFMGLTQIMAYLKGDHLPLPIEPLQFEGLYRLVRHPLYLFSLLVIWPMSTMSESLLAFNVATTLYFILGSVLEERKLVTIY